MYSALSYLTTFRALSLSITIFFLHSYLINIAILHFEAIFVSTYMNA